MILRTAMELDQDAAMVFPLGGAIDLALDEFEGGDYDDDIMGFDLDHGEIDENDNESEDSLKV